MNSKIYELLVVLRHNRQDSIARLKYNKIYIKNEHKFQFVDKFTIVYEDISYYFDVRLNNAEFFFYCSIQDDDEYIYANSFFSIKDIYDALFNLVDSCPKLISILNDEYKSKQIAEIKYGNESFKIRVLNLKLIKTDDTMTISDRTVSTRQVLLLLSLIQEKSNALFIKNKKYQNGIFRLIYILLCFKKDHEILTNKGWIIEENGKYNFTDKNISAVIFQVDSNNEHDAMQFLDNLKTISDKAEAITKFIELYNKYNNPNIKETQLKDDIYIKKLSDEIDNNSSLKRKLISSDLKKGIFQLGEEDDFHELSFTSEILKSSGKKYVLMILKRSLGFEYYLTKHEKEAIIKLGI